MKKINLIWVVAIFFFTKLNAQTHLNNNTIVVDNFDCYSALKLCDKVAGYFHQDSEDDQGNCDVKPVYFSFNTETSLSSELYLEIYTVDVVLYGPFQSDNISNCEAIATHQAQRTEKLAIEAVDHFLYFDLQPGFYIIELNPHSCASEFEIGTIHKNTFNCNQEIECQNCITSFSPTSGKYVVSGWVKEIGVPATDFTYSNSKIVVSFENASGNYTILPKGKIIDGWQRLEGIIDVPISATDIHITLEANSNDAVFDDIRFYPNDGSMMSYVYDPISLKLVAELDERNYATFYEYDEEGKLIRIKKETEKGTMTIQENRDNIVKKH
jgi:hypothetical protein